jgi:DNA-directed RNA polymerase subunit K/omega
MNYVTIEEIWKKYPNKYEALIKAAKEARRVIEGMEKNEIQLTENPYRYALKLALEEKDEDGKKAKAES